MSADICKVTMLSFWNYNLEEALHALW